MLGILFLSRLEIFPDRLVLPFVCLRALGLTLNKGIVGVGIESFVLQIYILPDAYCDIDSVRNLAVLYNGFLLLPMESKLAVLKICDVQ